VLLLPRQCLCEASMRRILTGNCFGGALGIRPSDDALGRGSSPRRINTGVGTVPEFCRGMAPYLLVSTSFPGACARLIDRVCLGRVYRSAAFAGFYEAPCGCILLPLYVVLSSDAVGLPPLAPRRELCLGLVHPGALAGRDVSTSLRSSGTGDPPTSVYKISWLIVGQFCRAYAPTLTACFYACSCGLCRPLAIVLLFGPSAQLRGLFFYLNIDNPAYW